MHLVIRFILVIAFLTIFVNSQGARGGGGGGSRGGGSGGARGTRTGGNGSSCTSDECRRKAGIITGSVLGGIFGLLAIIFTTRWCAKRWQGRPYRSNAEFIDQTSNEASVYEKDHFENGIWSSRYYQNGRGHGPYSLSLRFDRGMSTVSGEGNDDVGTFTIDGVFSVKSHRMALTKKYQAGTGDSLQNFGHTVTIQVTWNGVNEQFEGKWFIQTARYRDEDKFELKIGSPTKIFATPRGL